jgi:hypothetical protein
MLEGAELLGSEYGWHVSKFPDALQAASQLRYACIGGQFQFRWNGSVREMYWLEADSSARLPGEAWVAYAERSCREVLAGFQRILASANWAGEAATWKGFLSELGTANPIDCLAFVAYFSSEVDYAMSNKSLERTREG